MRFNKKAAGGRDIPEMYEEDEIAWLEKHIEDNFGKYANVVHELFSPDIHLDIAVVDPTPERDFYTLVTMGMGAHRMNVPPELADKKLERAELMICLPSDWDIKSDDEIWYWPLRWLKTLGRLPIEQNTWLGWGHTVLTRKDVSENASFRCMMLVSPDMFGEAAGICQLPNGDEINIYQMVPIYRGEMNYKLENEAEALLELMNSKDVDVLDIHRESVCEEVPTEVNITPFSERAEQFWKWFSKNERTLSKMVEKRQDYDPEDVVSLVNEGVSLISDDIYFNLGGKHEFTFSVNGNVCLFYLLPYVISKMPEKYRKKWIFNPYMPGTGGASFGLKMFGINVDADKMMVCLKEDGRKATVGFFNEKLATLDEGDRYAMFHTLMENVTGELLPQMCISETVFLDHPSEGMFPLTDLEAKLKDVASKKGTILEPSESFTGYELEPDDSGELRFDISKGITCYPKLLNDYYGGGYSEYSKVAGYGTMPAFIFFAAPGKEQDALMEECSEIFEAMEEALGKKGSGDEIGIVTGCAAGEKCGYIDMILFGSGKFSEKAAEALRPFRHAFFLSSLIPNGSVSYIGSGDGIDPVCEVDILNRSDLSAEVLMFIDDTVPVKEWDYDITGKYARKLNNVGRYEEAFLLLEKLEAEGKDDAVWNYRIGYSLYFLDREAEASVYFQRCIDIGDEDGTGTLQEDAEDLLKSCLRIMNGDTEEEEE